MPIGFDPPPRQHPRLTLALAILGIIAILALGVYAAHH
jgi:hypothetical protein